MKKYKLNFCTICKDVIPIKAISGIVIEPAQHAKKQTCLNPDCLTELRQRNQQKHPKVFEEKWCKRYLVSFDCMGLISLTWPNGNVKSKPDYDKAEFCSKHCRATWQADKYEGPITPKERSLPVRDQPIDLFIYGGMI